MPLLYAIFALIIVGIGLWIINAFIPMAGSIKAILNLVVVISVVGGDVIAPCPSNSSEDPSICHGSGAVLC